MTTEWKPVPCTAKCKRTSYHKFVVAKLGYEEATCPTCKAHVRDGICLNICHLSKSAQERFVALMRGVSKDG